MIKKKVFLKRTNHPQRYQQHQQQRRCPRQHQHAVHSITQCLALKCITIVIAWMMMMGSVVEAAPPHAAIRDNTGNSDAYWPRMKHYDIWSDDDRQELMAAEKHQGDDDDEIYDDNDFYADESIQTLRDFDWNVDYDFMRSTNASQGTASSEPVKRQQKVIHLFPVSVDGECLSDDGRRTGTCFNAYECRNKGGQAKGECAHGFGVCCIFIANCNETVSNNITYLVSPSFPSFMPNNVTNCNLKIKLMNDDISQVRIDFYHFILGQPNRRTGVCDGDVFNVSGGPGGTFSLCGQNSGQHLYYDVGGRMLPRQVLYGSLRPLRYEDLYPGRNNTNETSMEVEIGIHFAQRFLPTRLWEIRISQIPFSQRAPAGCLQYFTGAEGVFQTFNFADNGRHLANQNYRICMRQEVEMCSIVYQPCDEQSFRIGPGSSTRLTSMANGATLNSGGGAGAGGAGTAGMNPASMVGIMNMPLMDISPAMDQIAMQVLADDVPGMAQMNMTASVITSTVPTTTTAVTSTVTTTTTLAPSISTTVTPVISSAATEMASSSAAPAADAPAAGDPAADDPVADDPAADDPVADDPAASSDASTSPLTPTTTVATTTTTTVATLSDDVEGSGDGEDGDTRFRPTPANAPQRPRPTRGGFDLFGFLRSAFDFNARRGRQMRQLSYRQKRQFYSNCRDRITMPCIVEDFIGTGLGPLPGCEPVHCGMQFCSNGMWPCRIESTVTPFYVGIHFGDGSGKGSAEDNIGACLRYQQVQCM